MYYENKSSFYIKQYGPAALIITISLVLISIGMYLGIKAIGNSNLNKANLQAETDAKLTLPEELSTLSAFTRSKEYKVSKVKENAVVQIQVNKKKYDINLIGIKAKGNDSTLLNKMEIDLKDKMVTLEFDNVKEDNGTIYGYVYLKDNFYNEKILADGAGELKAERKNINRLDVLLSAEIKARHSEKGVWKIV